MHWRTKRLHVVFRILLVARVGGGAAVKQVRGAALDLTYLLPSVLRPQRHYDPQCKSDIRRVFPVTNS